MGEVSRARELALAAADQAHGRGQDGLALRALHELARLGEPAAAAPRLEALSARVDGPFAAHDALLLAAEAAGAAAAAHREARARGQRARRGRPWRRRARGLRARAHAGAARCPGSRRV